MYLKFFKIIIISLFIGILNSSCSSSYTQHGHLMNESGYNIIEENQDNKNTVLKKLGSPSSKDPLNENTWLYITSIHEKKPFKSSKKIEQNVIALSFDVSDKLVSKRLYTLKDGNIITPLEDHTISYRKKPSLFKEIFGNLGRFRPTPN